MCESYAIDTNQTDPRKVYKALGFDLIPCAVIAVQYMKRWRIQARVYLKCKKISQYIMAYNTLV